MSFGRFGTKTFVTEAKVQPFVDHLARGKLTATRCPRCRKISFPPRIDCAACGPVEVEWVEIAGKGRLETFTTVRYGPAGFEHETPYTLAVVLFEHGVRVFGQLDKGIPPARITIGMQLAAAALPLPSGRFSYHFVETL